MVHLNYIGSYGLVEFYGAVDPTPWLLPDYNNGAVYSETLL
jgi:hypothetical protein